MGEGETVRSVTLDVADVDGIALFREALVSAGYDPEHMRPMLRSEGENLLPRPEDVPVVRRLLPRHDRLADLLRLFELSIDVDAEDAKRALAPLPLDRAARLGVIAVSGGVVRGTIRVLPSLSRLIAADRAHETEADLPPDHVMGVATSSLFLASVTIRRPIRDALDIGCGTGIQSVLAAEHAKRVVACDVNPRALAFTTFNAYLNGLMNVECRRGSFFEPVHDETFDLIVSNPPFVISPDAALVFRDAGMRGDDVSRTVVREAARHLAAGGHAFVLVSWGVRLGEDWDAPLRRWVDGTGCDAWLLHQARGTALGYAATWNTPLQTADLTRYEAAIDRWTAYYRELGYDSLGYGAVILRKRAAKTNWVRADDIHGQREPASGEQIARLIAVEDALAARDPRALLDERLAVEPRHRLDQVLRARSGAFVVEEATLKLETGIRFSTAIDAFTAELIAALDGTRTLREALARCAARFAESGVSSVDFEREGLEVARTLLRQGFLRLN